MTMYRPDRSLLLQLRDAAKVERDEMTKFNLKTSADDLDEAIRAFKETPNGITLATINGHWARAVRALGFASPIDPTSGGARMREVA